MRASGYARVSPEEQARDGVSVSAQQAKIDAYNLVKDGDAGGRAPR
jgi:DNA invertase Pin-like site-specific DNA recombinase